MKRLGLLLILLSGVAAYFTVKYAPWQVYTGVCVIGLVYFLAYWVKNIYTPQEKVKKEARVEWVKTSKKLGEYALKIKGLCEDDIKIIGDVASLLAIGRAEGNDCVEVERFEFNIKFRRSTVTITETLNGMYLFSEFIPGGKYDVIGLMVSLANSAQFNSKLHSGTAFESTEFAPVG